MPRPVLIAIDASPASHAIVALAANHCQPSAHTLHVVLAVDPSFTVHTGAAPYTVEEDQEYPAACAEQQAAEHAVETALAVLRDAGFECQGQTLPGEPLAVILERAAALECALIVMGHRHLSRLGRLLDPSVSAQVIEQGRWPVLVAANPEH